MLQSPRHTDVLCFIFISAFLLLSSTVSGQCMLKVPNNPLTAAGLATPYEVSGCDQTADNPTFVEAVIFDPAKNSLSVYNPLVINAGTKPAVVPTPPTLPPNAVVGIWFGTNGDTLTLTGPNLAAGKCVNGQGKSIFGQFAYCNAPAFFAASKGVNPPALGTASDGQTCLTTRDFALVDMDQSDNVVTTYIVTADNKLAQNTANNRKTHPGSRVISNGSDNGLLIALDKIFNCKPFQAPDLADCGNMVSALALNEIQSAKLQKAPVATVPDNDPMATVDGAVNLAKRNLYRAGVNQDQGASGDGKQYCQNFVNVAVPRYTLDKATTLKAASPDAGAANNMFNFLCQRFEASYGADGLNCVNLLNAPSPITTVKNADDVAISCTITPPGQKKAATVSAAAKVSKAVSSAAAKASKAGVTAAAKTAKAGVTAAAKTAKAGATVPAKVKKTAGNNAAKKAVIPPSTVGQKAAGNGCV